MNLDLTSLMKKQSRSSTETIITSKGDFMKAQTIENTKTEESKNLYDLLDEKEKEQENYYPEFDDQA